jgi:O-antigen ligase
LSVLDKENPRIGLIDLLVLVFISLGFLWIFHPNIPSFAAGMEGFRKFAFMLFGFLIGRYWFKSRESLVVLMKVLIFPVTLIAIYGIKQYLFPTALDFRLIELSTGSPITYMMGGHIRAFSTLSGPFHLGILLVASSLLLLALYLAKVKRNILFLGSLFLIQVIALVMTVTKSNMFALIAGSLVLVFLLTKKPLRTAFRLFIIGIIGLTLVWIIYVATANNAQFRTVHQGIQDLINPTQAQTMLFRIDLWREEVIPLIQASPWTGYGTGSAGEGLGFYFEKTKSTYIASHNLFFKVIFEIGFPGLLLFLIILGLSFVTLFHNHRRLKDPLFLAFNAWVLAFLIGVLLASVTGPILDAYPVNLLFWIVLGIATKLPKLHNSSAVDKAKSTSPNYIQLDKQSSQYG